jgi:competence protein ComEA
VKKHHARFVAYLIFIPCFLCISACDSQPGVEIQLTTVSKSYSNLIYIGGAVNNPGYYPFNISDTLDEMIDSAGGLETGADISQVNISFEAIDCNMSPQKIDINRAEQWLLEALPGIGATLAGNIIDYRQQNGPYHSIEDLLKVNGIGESTLGKIRDYITVYDAE